MRRTLGWASILVVLTSSASAEVYRLAEMNAEQIRGLNRETTAVLIPGGILEEHGPYLPSFTDGYWNERVTQDLARSISERPGWSALIFPTIPLGNSGANDIGGKYSFPGTYTVRFSTLRAIFMDLATELGEQKFKWVFIIHGHGAPNHNRALDQAADFFHDTYGGHMINLGGLMPVIASWDGNKSEGERKEDGLPIHAGMDETSMLLALRPDLVNPAYKTATPFAGDEMDALIRIAQDADWPGYFGSPRLARPEQYANGWQIASQEAVKLALKILDGLDEHSVPRFGDEMQNSAPDVALDRASLRHEAGVANQQQAWLKKKKLK